MKCCEHKPQQRLTRVAVDVRVEDVLGVWLGVLLPEGVLLGVADDDGVTLGVGSGVAALYRYAMPVALPPTGDPPCRSDAVTTMESEYSVPGAPVPDMTDVSTAGHVKTPLNEFSVEPGGPLTSVYTTDAFASAGGATASNTVAKRAPDATTKSGGDGATNCGG